MLAEGDITFERISFSHPDRGAVFEGWTCISRRGRSRRGGLSGAGKST